MAPRRKAAVEVEVEDDLDELEDLEDLADDVEEAEVEEEEADDEEEAPRRKKKAKAKKVKAESDTIGSADLADALGTTGRELRVMLRQRKVGKNENNRYEWDSVEDALEQMGFDDIDEAQEALSESRSQRLEELKERVGAKTKAQKAAEDEEDDEEEEDEAPPPKARTKKTTAKKTTRR